MSSFASLGVSAELCRALADEGYTTPTPIQAKAMPLVLEGRDVLAAAQTGTGKTAGFAVPLMQRLYENSPARALPRRPLRALILTPTRELAAQVEESFRVYGRYLPLKSTVVFGGVNINPQIQAMQRGVDILVATPGRLLDHIGQRTIDLSRVEVLVLDEADRMLDMGFIRDIRKILALLPARRQNLLFSATFSDEIRTLADGLLHSPVRVEVARQNAESELVTQLVYPVDRDNKRDLLVYLLAELKIRQALVFTRTKHGADRLAKQLVRDGINAVPIHGDRSQGQRTRALADFKAGTARILVATDIAARGLDIDQLPHVINFELPNMPEDYVHRIGRTGRAGTPGEAISLVSVEEAKFLVDIEKLLKKRLPRLTAEGFTPAPRVAGFPQGNHERSGAFSERDFAERPVRAAQPRGNAGAGSTGGASSRPRPASTVPRARPTRPAVPRPRSPFPSNGPPRNK